MDESQKDNQLYHFSKKVLFLSLLFLMINLAWFGLIFSSQPMADFRPVAPKLIFAENQKVSLKSSFDAEFLSAEPSQVLLTGTMVKTGEQSFAEIRLENNVVRLDENTELTLLENNFKDPSLPRFVFRLQSGTIWVNAFDPIVVRTDRGQATFTHTVGVYTYTDPLNRLTSVIGNVDLALLDHDGDLLAEFVLPLKTQITFVNSQLIPEYALLEYSKLKKELKMSPISKSILEESWVKRNTSDDISLFLEENSYIFSDSVYRFKNLYHMIRTKLVLIPSQKRVEYFSWMRTKLRYLLGAVQEADDRDLAETILAELDHIVSEFIDDPLFVNLIRRQFFAIRNVETDTPAYAVKENLRGHLFSATEPEFLRSYLADLDFLMRIESLKQAEKLAETWLSKWKPGIRTNHFAEFQQQSRIYQSIMLAYADLISPKLLVVLDAAGGYRLEESGSDETLFEIALERLEMSKYLVSALRYSDAKNYLRNSYDQLNLAERETSAAARDLFLEEAALVGERIAFAEQSLKAAAEGIDEDQFLDYLSNQERDEALADRFVAFIEGQVVPEEIVVPPTTEEAVQRFSTERIVVIDEDIMVDPEIPFEFDIQYGRFIDRAADGSSISFSAHYDYSTNVVFDITLNEIPLTGNYTLNDFVQVAKSSGAETAIVDLASPDIGAISDFLNLADTEEGDLSQIVAQDLAVQLMIRELESFGITVPSPRDVAVLNKLSLNEFRITDIFIDDPEKNRQLGVSFDYNSSTKTLSNIKFKDLVLTLPPTIQAEVFIDGVLESLYGQEKIEKVRREVISELNKFNLSVDEGDFSFADSTLKLITLDKVSIKGMPITFTGTYDRTLSSFVMADHVLLSAQDIAPNDYLVELARLWTVDYLTQQGIAIDSGNIYSSMPSSKIQIKNYVRGDKVLDFTFEVASNRLTKIELLGTDTVVETMTFEEFALIEGGRPTIAPEVNDVAPEDQLNGAEFETTDLFYEGLADCTPATATINFGTVDFAFEILEEAETGCLVHSDVSGPDPTFSGTEMDCEIAKAAYDLTSFIDYFARNFLTICEGSYIDAVTNL